MKKLKKPQDIFRGIGRIFSQLSTDLFLKVVSLGLAVLLWFLVGGEDTIEKTVRVPVEVINLPRDLVISNQFKNEIEVSVTGPRSVILDLNEEKLTRQVDLSSATPGTMVLENDNEHIPVPRSVQVQRVQPASIILSIDKLIQKEFPVVANTVGVVADGFQVDKIRMNPEFIVITGPENLLRQKDELQTSYISINGLRNSSQRQVPLELTPAFVDLIGETLVTADIIVSPVTQTEVTMVSVETEDDAELLPSRVSVTAKIPEILLENGESPEFFIRAKAMEQGTDGRMKVVVIPKNNQDLPIKILSIIPAYVQNVSYINEKKKKEAEANEVEVIEIKEEILKD